MCATSLPLVQARALVLRTHGHTMREGAMRNVADLLPNAEDRELPETDNMAEFLGHYTDQVEQFMFGASSRGNPDRALVTVMFTDIVASTEHLASRGDACWVRCSRPTSGWCGSRSRPPAAESWTSSETAR